MENTVQNRSDILMLSGVTAFCADCGDEQIFVPAEGGCAAGDPPGDGWGAGGEFCCTGCDAAVFLLEVLDNTGAVRPLVA